eukprot:g1039.t1
MAGSKKIRSSFRSSFGTVASFLYSSFSVVFVFIILSNYRLGNSHTIFASSIPQDEYPSTASLVNFRLHLIRPSTEEILLMSENQKFFNVSVGIVFENPVAINNFDAFCQYCALCFGTPRCVHLYSNNKDDFSSKKPVKRLSVPISKFHTEHRNVVNITLRKGWKILTYIKYSFNMIFIKNNNHGKMHYINDLNEKTIAVDVESSLSSSASLSPKLISPSSVVPGLNLTFEYPPDGVVIRTPKMIVSMGLSVEDEEEFNRKFNPIQDFLYLCFELEKTTNLESIYPRSISGKYTRDFCSELNEPIIKLFGLGDGMYTLTTWLVDNSTGKDMSIITENTSSTFEIKCNCGQKELWYTNGPVPPYLPYAERFKNLPTGHTAIPWKHDDSQLWLPPYKLLPPIVANSWHRQKRSVILVVGVKVAATAFDYRSALRATWFNRQEDRKDCAFWFVIGYPDASENKKITDDIIQKLIVEAKTYKDMLLGPNPAFLKADLPFPWVLFNVKDSYYTLVEKTVTFMTFATMTYNFQYLFMCDEDIYLRADMLINVLKAQGERFRFFAGQVWEKQFGRPMRPIRDHESKNYISYQHWKMRDLPPIAIGPHYLMSRDCVNYIVENKKFLKGVGTLEDVSVTVWLFSIGVHPEHVKWFSNAKNMPCQEGLVSYADLKPKFIRLIHQNVVTGNKFCHGIDKVDDGNLAKGINGYEKIKT